MPDEDSFVQETDDNPETEIEDTTAHERIGFRADDTFQITTGKKGKAAGIPEGIDY